MPYEGRGKREDLEISRPQSAIPRTRCCHTQRLSRMSGAASWSGTHKGTASGTEPAPRLRVPDLFTQTPGSLLPSFPPSPSLTLILFSLSSILDLSQSLCSSASTRDLAIDVILIKGSRGT